MQKANDGKSARDRSILWMEKKTYSKLSDSTKQTIFNSFLIGNVRASTTMASNSKIICFMHDSCIHFSCFTSCVRNDSIRQWANENPFISSNDWSTHKRFSCGRRLHSMHIAHFIFCICLKTYHALTLQHSLRFFCRRSEGVYVLQWEKHKFNCFLINFSFRV